MKLHDNAQGNKTDRDSALRVACPACQRKVAWNQDNPHRPFCTERCKTADFIAWTNEEQRIPGDYAVQSEGG